LQINSRIIGDLDPNAPDTYEIGDDANIWKKVTAVDAKFTDDVEVGDDLTVTGDASVGGTSTLTGDVTCQGDLTVDVDATITGELTISGTGTHSVSEEFANEVMEEFARPTGATVGLRGIATTGELNHSQTSGTFSTVTGSTLTITTSGRPVLLFMAPFDDTTSEGYVGLRIAGGAATAHAGAIRIRRDTTAIYENYLVCNTAAGNDLGISWPPGAFIYLDVVSAGTYSYDIQAREDAASTLQIASCKFMAVEL
jgi:cytoskeletal protein CcmA (bactofilin family)